MLKKCPECKTNYLKKRRRKCSVCLTMSAAYSRILSRLVYDPHYRHFEIAEVPTIDAFCRKFFHDYNTFGRRFGPNEKPSVDRIDSEKGYMLENMQIIPLSWNRGKTSKCKATRETLDRVPSVFLAKTVLRKLGRIKISAAEATARKLGISVRTVYRILRGGSHRHLTTK